MTKIQWTEKTWNPITGCSKVSAGCKNCYAEGVAKRFWGERKFTDVQFHPERLKQPMHWRKPRMVFVNSMSDLFHEDVDNWEIEKMFAVMALAPRHTYQILTKRPARMLEWMTNEAAHENTEYAASLYAADWGGGKQAELYGGTWGSGQYGDEGRCEIPPGFEDMNIPWPLPNVWLGVSAEDQETLDERVPLLLQTPAAVRWVSLEPLLGPVDLTGIRDDEIGAKWDVLGAECTHEDAHVEPDTNAVICRQCDESSFLDWVVVGGESGPKARRCNTGWVRRVVNDCKAAGVPCFVKQLGANIITETDIPNILRPAILNHPKGGDPSEWPEALRVREWPLTSPAPAPQSSR